MVPFKIRTKSPVFEWSHDNSKTDLQNVRISNESGFRMVGFRIPTVSGMQIVHQVT